MTMIDWTWVRAADHSFGVLDGGQIPAETADYSTGLAVVLAAGAQIYTGVDTGPVRVHAAPLSCRPTNFGDPNDWSEIVEVSVHAPLGDLKVDSLADGQVPGLPQLASTGPGWYRMLVCARGRDTAFDQVCEEPVEDYLIATWPEKPSPSLLVRASDRCGQGVRESATRPVTSPLPPPAELREQIDFEQRRRSNLRSKLLRAAGRSSEELPVGQPPQEVPQEPAPRPADQ
ncbi:hypothetical protein OG455_27575 [Kitasatospora sp. NBC_01287]|uniref:hypothetical protein n=1 Tax=Kitasatospora sp. NBC_01287 TaxID=2903573 RepID=UPI00225574C4|nr:hypothetical protein [Kitasatospora sp. NBC_01287]MCX4749221.1 hypothetical protein [Kitasatospora sp. NBC_01287]